MLNQTIIAFLKKNGLDNPTLSVPPKPEMGDFSLPCFDAAKIKKNSPVEAAKELCAHLLQLDLKKQGIARVEAIGPYVNFFLDPTVVAETVLGEVKKQKKQYGFNDSGANKKVVIEYPSNNTHKELHIGHLRNICIGGALVNIFRANSYQVVPVNYVNDLGAHVAKCLWGINKFHSQEKPPKGGEQKWLGQIYAEASRYLEEHPEDKSAIYDLQTKLEAHDKSIWPLYQKTRTWSLKKFEQIFKQLGLRHSYVFYEQDVKTSGQKVVDDLLKNKIAQVGEGGAIIVDLKKYNLDIGLLRKSTGAGLYLTSDLGLALAKNKKYPNIFESVHLTSIEQNFYFQQLFKILELAGYRYQMKHIGYGLVTLASGKMASRTGNVVLIEDIRDEVYEKIYNETKERHPEWSKKKLHDTSLRLALAAIKFEFLKHEAEKNLTFDAKAATAFDGFTGPYVLYAVARIHSLSRKTKIKDIQLKHCDLLQTQEEKNLLMLIDGYNDVLVKAFTNYNPSVVVKYAFELAKSFNDFYNKCSVVNAGNIDTTAARMSLALAAKQVLENVLQVLTIDTVAEM